MAKEEKPRDYLKPTTTNLRPTRRRRLRKVKEQERVAVVGMGCRFPGGVAGPEDLWELVASGTDAISEFPADRGWDLAGLFDPDPDHAGTSYARQGGFIHEAGDFDAAFFGISPREALAMDPQQRLLLEIAWEALENAGIDPATLPGSRTGVFAGATPSGYGLAGVPAELEGQLWTGTTPSVISGRVAYALGLEGPAVTVDTSCSSALVALHLACQALRAGECELALACGVTVMATPDMFVLTSRQRALALDGRCKAFSAAADGTAWSEGAGMIVLEPLSRARARGHRVLAVIRGSAVNQDGASNGLTAPNGASQQRVIRAALAAAGLDASEVDAVEAHGSGTVLGDPVEAQALIATYGQDRDRPVWLGSVKSNIGHTQQAAGAAGLIKMVMALRHQLLPATLHAEVPSSRVNWDSGQLRLLTEPVPWTADGRVRRAGVSSFGISGTNAHVIVEDAPAATSSGIDRDNTGGPLVPGVHAWALSGRSAGGLAGQAARLTGDVAAHPGLDVADVGWSLAGRSVFGHRAVVVGTGREQLLDGLTGLAAGEPGGNVVSGELPVQGAGKVVFVFPGQGTQWAGMGRELTGDCPVFAARLAECAAALAPHVDWDLLDVINQADGAPRLDSAAVAQPVLWAVMVSLAAVWQAAGIQPDAVVGHSQGEIAAATVAGILTVEDAARVVAVRGRLLAGLGEDGGMVSVVMPEAEVRELLLSEREGRRESQWDGLSVAAVNGPAQVVVSGPRAALAELGAVLSARRVMRWPVPDTGFVAHSARAEQLARPLMRALDGIGPRAGRVPLLSTVTGAWVKGPELDGRYWYANVRQTVRFADAVVELAGLGHRTFIEVSPNPVLGAAIVDTTAETGLVPGPVVGTLRQDGGGGVQVLTALARAFTAGIPVDWAAVLGGGRRLELPTYAFQRQRYWLTPGPAGPSSPRVLPDPALAAPAAAASGTAGEAGELARKLAGRPATEQEELLTKVIRAGAARVLGHGSADQVSPERPFSELGFTSVTALEMRLHLAAVTGLDLPATTLYDYPAPDVLAGHLRTRLTGVRPAPAPVPAAVMTAEPVAIVGMGCRFPGGVAGPEDLWELVASRTDAIGGFPVDRGWDLDRLFDPDPDHPGTSYVRGGGFVHDAGDFDAGFFSISPREALAMDPQQRLLLEVCWEALERAGIDPRSLRGGLAGVFVGGYTSGYALGAAGQAAAELEGHLITGNATSVISGRVAYVLGLEGPAVTVDTACSSSLVAMHLACQALRAGECELALAGGVTILATPADLVGFSRQRGLAGDGRSKAFSAGADGMGMAEGAGMVVLEPLSRAQARGHQVLAVIRGSAVNQDGASNGLTAPNGPSQQRVIRAALASAGLSADQVDAVEAHGTGTKLGDPIEAQALIATYGQGRVEGQPAWLGSVKSNIGHTQAAAGVAGVIKMVQALRHQLLPQTLHVEQPSPHVDWDAGDIKLLTEPVSWPASDRPRRAAVSSFGISGTNAHLILEEPPGGERGEHWSERPGGERGKDCERGETLLLVSARSAAGLAGQARRLAEFVAGRPDLDPGDVAWSLAATRSVFEHRAVVLGSGRDELMAGLGAMAAGQPSGNVVSGIAGDTGRVGFVFAGQGTQRAGMGRDLAAACPAFAAELKRVCGLLEERLGVPVAEVVLAEEGHEDGRADQTLYAQAGLFAVQVALVKLLAECGVTPDAVTGHSVGEVAAAHVAGVLSLEDACTLVAARAALMQSLPGGGAMYAVAAPEEVVAPVMAEMLAGVDGEVALAAVNGPASVVVSGSAAAAGRVAEVLAGRGVRVRRLRVSDGFHSPLMDPVLGQLGQVADGLAYRRAELVWASGVSGGLAEECEPGYWVRQAREPVRFGAAVGALAAAGVRLFVEIGPDGTLSAMGPAAIPGGEGVFIPVQRPVVPAPRALLAALAQAHVRGVTVDWPAVLGGGTTVELPTYAFQRQRYWPCPPVAPAVMGGDGAATGVEARFWAVVEGQDAAGLAAALGVEGRTLGEVLPALAAWRRRELDASVTDAWRYQVSWVPRADPGPGRLAGSWLLVTLQDGDTELAAGCARTLAARGAAVVTVSAAAADLDRAALAAAVSRALASDGTGDGGGLAPVAEPVRVAGVVSLLGVEEQPVGGGGPLDGLAVGVAATQSLVQALGDAQVSAPLWVVTRGAVAAGPGEVPRPVQAQVWGLGRVAALEHPDRWGGLIDLPPGVWEEGSSRSRTMPDERVAGWMCAVLAGCGEDQAAVRGTGVWARRLTPAPRPRLRGGERVPRGSVLITGGTGAIGGRVARWLAGRGAPAVVLTSRSGPAAAGVPALAAQVAAAGTTVQVTACDAASRSELAGLVGQVTTAGRLSGVVHAAGLAQDRTLEQSSTGELAAVLAAKAGGARWLDELTAGLDLDLFVLFSSIAATWGSGGQPGYAAANAYLDALAERRRAGGLVATSLAWGPWGGGGMAGQENVAQLRRRGIMPMAPAAAIQALAQAIDAGDHQLTIADVDWARFTPPFTVRRPSPLLAALPDASQALAGGSPGDTAGGAGAPLSGQLAGLPLAEQDRMITDLIRTEAATVLGHPSAEGVEVTKAFKEAGFDSLTAIELCNRLGTAIGLNLPATLLYDYPVPTALAAYLRAVLLGVPDPATDLAAAPAAAVAAGEPVVIVGMGCRFPGGVAGPEDLWELVASGTDAISGFPADRGWDLEGLYDPDPAHAGTSYTRRGGFVAGVAEFDPGFFGISPREALAMDPQQRLLLEVGWEALERAGIDPASLRGSRTGVFAGASPAGYETVAAAGAEDLGGYLLSGTTTSVLSGRIAYVLGLEGPAVTVDTACSSSLVAMHLACQALRAGECELALVGGVTVMATPGVFTEFSRQRGLAVDGRCKAYADAADGTGWSEGAGVLVLEPLSRAWANGHRVLALIRGSAVNQDGASNGLTAPNGPSQQRVIRAALARAGLDASQVDAVEGHGTGTELGDPIEAQALIATYGQGRDRPLWLGSVKSNIGHPQQAAGVAGVIKMVAAMERGVIPATLHVDTPSTHVDWAAGQVRLLTEAVPWPSTGQPRRAAVSAFGISGTNAHLILEQPPEPPEPPEPPGALGVPGAPASQRGAPASGLRSRVLATREDAGQQRPGGEWGEKVWVLSARSTAGLAGQAARLAEFMARRPDLDPGDVGWSLATTRSAFEHRAVVTGIGREELVAGLGAVAAGRPAANVLSGTAARGGPARVVFVFAGAGAQWAGMGRDLVRSSPVFAGRLAECGRALAPHVGWDLLDVVNEAEGAPGLQGQDVVQPVLWAVSVALAAVWEAAGVAPDAVVGHSQGEIAAATVAGMLSVQDAARVVAARGRVLAGLGGRGGMASVAAGTEQVEELLGRWAGRVSVAAVNGPEQVVVAGELAALAEVAEACRERGLRTQVVPVDYASHCALVEPVELELTAALAPVRPGPGRIPMVSGMTGEVVSGSELAAGYWYASCRAPVRFAAAVETLAELGYRAFIEVSPHPVLTGPVSDSLEHAGYGGALVGGTLRRNDGGPARLLAAFAKAHVQGVGVNWPAVLGGGIAVELPTYAFQRERFWPRPAPAAAGDVVAAGLGAVGHPLLGAAVQVAGGDQLVLTGRVSVQAQPWLADHVVGGVVLMPGTALLELAIRAGDAAGCGQVVELTLLTPMALPADGAIQVQVVVGGAGADERRPVEVFGRPAGPGRDEEGEAPWTCHARGLLAPAAPVGAQASGGEMAAWPPPGADPVSLEGWYERLAEGGLGYGEAFRGLRAAWRRGDEVFAEAALPDQVAGDAARFGLHPALLDAVLHAAGLTGLGDDGGMLVPFAWTGVLLHAAGAAVLRARLRADQDRALIVDVADGTGQPVLSVRALALRPVTAAQLHAARANGTGQGLLSVNWVPVPVPAGPVTGTWAVTGPDPYQAAAGLTEAGAQVTRYPDLTALATAISQGGPVPDLIAITAADHRVGCAPANANPPGGGDVVGGGDPADAGDDAGLVAQALAGEVLTGVQEWLGGPASGARLVIMTRAAVAARPGDPVSGLAGSGVWGLVRSVQTENPGRIILADLPGPGPAGEAWALLAAAAGTGEPELAIRDGQLYGRRLARPTAGLPIPGGTQPWRLDPAGGGTLDTLALAPCPQAAAPLAAGQVRVAVRAAGLNFRDVLIGLGMYPGEGIIGSEIAGIVTGTGPGVSGLAPGDRVLGMTDGGFGPLAVTDARLLAPIPPGWSFATAAAVPVAFLTAWYGLGDLGGARAGQRLLVHAATGGVGMAAVSIARHLGLEIFGTASPAKHHVLAALGLDADHIGSSRDASFADRFREATGGAGMDIVLNALAGELTDASLGLLPRGGMFVEMGKTDRRDPDQVARDYPGVSYRAFDVAEAGPDRIGQILAEVTRLLAAGALRLPPVLAWDVRQAPDAFRYMSQARHTGKIVLTIPAGARSGQPSRPAGTVLITGGTGTLGALTARHLARTGRAASLALVSRSGPAAHGVPALAAGLARDGAGVRVLAADLARPGAAAAVTAAVARDGRLSAVIHAAGVLDDATTGSLTPARVAAVMAPKAAAAWQLHQATQDADLDGFVLFSSAASVLGGAGQGNYAAANAFLDALAAHRRAAGLPAQSLAWGLWEPDSAMTAGLGEAGRARITRTGMAALTPAQGLALLDAATAQDQPLLLAARIDIDRLRAQAARGGDIPPLWQTLAGAQPRPAAHGNATPGEPSGTLAGQLAALAPNDREHILTSLVCEHAAAVLGHPGPAAIDPSHSFTEHGFDSLTAIELRNRLATATGLALAATLTFDYPTPAALAVHLRTAMFNEQTSSTAVIKEIDKLESALMAIPENDGNRSKVITRLEAVLQDFRTGAVGNVAALHEIDKATDDEIFDLLDKELGI
jgi:candicidin polyketide synthase FscB